MIATTLFEKHRPTELRNVVGQPKAVATIQRLLDRGGLGGQALWISGPSGTGKTTIGRIAARNVADEHGTVEYDSADALDAAELDRIRDFAQTYSMGRGGRAFIINEAHALSGRAIRTLLGLLEHIPPHVVYIFTTTKEGETDLFDGQIDAAPLLSRCLLVKTTNQGFASAYAERAREIAQAEGLDGQPLDVYLKLMKSVNNNARAALQRIAAGQMLAAQ